MRVPFSGVIKVIKMKFRIENGSLDALFERVRFAAPELIELNKTPKVNSFYFNVERREKVFA